MAKEADKIRFCLACVWRLSDLHDPHLKNANGKKRRISLWRPIAIVLRDLGQE